MNCAAVSCGQKRQVHIPLFVVSVHKATDHFGQCLVEPFHETIRRRMIGSSSTFLHLRKSTYLLEEIRLKVLPLVSMDFKRTTKYSHKTVHQSVSQSPPSDPAREMLPSIWWNNHQAPECTCFVSQRVVMVQVCPHRGDPWDSQPYNLLKELGIWDVAGGFHHKPCNMRCVALHPLSAHTMCIDVEPFQAFLSLQSVPQTHGHG